MKVGIDCRIWGVKHGGIGRYVQEVVENLQVIDQRNNYVVFLRKDDFTDVPQRRKWKKVVADLSPYSLKEQAVLPKIFLKEKLDLLHVPHFNVPIFYRRPFIVTIHDLLWHQQFGLKQTSRSAFVYSERNKLVYFLKYLGYRLVVRNALMRAKKIIVPTSVVKKDLINRFGMGKDKVVVSYGAGLEKLKVKPFGFAQGVSEKLKVDKPYILYVGSLAPHKNVETLIEAVGLLGYQDVGLVIVGPKGRRFGEVSNKVHKLGLGNRVFFTGLAGDGRLAYLYKNALGLVFPTLFEGFGMPGIEAMGLGCPVLCSDIPVLREVYKDAAIYFNPKSPPDISKKMVKLVEDEKLRKEVIARGFRRAKIYSWKKMASEVLRIYEEVC